MFLCLAASAKTTEGTIAGLKLHQAYDFLETMKNIVEEDQGHRAKAILEAYPQLIPACIEIQRRLGMTNISVAADHKPTSLSVIESINTAPTISQSSYQQHLLEQVFGFPCRFDIILETNCCGVGNENVR